MKYIVDEASFIKAEVIEALHESSGKTVKNYYLHGIFSTPDKQNRNGRIYPTSIWEKEVKNYQKEIEGNTVNTLGEIDHPPRQNVDPLKAAIKIVELKMENGMVMGRAKILNNNSPETNQLKALIDEGMSIGVSSRGVGKVTNGIVEDFKLITYDCVSFPSDYNANLAGLTESLNESIGQKNFEVTEDGAINEVQICTESACHMFEKSDIESAIKQKFSEVLASLKPKDINTLTEMRVNFDYLVSEMKKLNDAQLAKVFALVLQLQD